MRSRLFTVLVAVILLLNGSAWADVDSSTATVNPIPAYQFPSLVDENVSEILHSKLNLTATDMPKPYITRCHVQQNLTSTNANCYFGNLKSKTTIVLFGDSHALSWFPAVEKLAIAKNWRFLSLTMSSCWPATIPPWNSVKKKLMTNCTIWRESALKQIAQIKPYLTLVTGTRGFSTIDSNGMVLAGEARASAWNLGMTSTLSAIKSASRNTVLISDTPISRFAFPSCLILSPDSIKNCSTPAAKAIDTNWLTVERNLSASLHVLWVNPTQWICNSDPCSPVADDTLIYRDGAHLTASFAVSLEKPLWAELSGHLNS